MADVQLKIKAGVPFIKVFKVTLPTGRGWWTDVGDFNFAMQIRVEEDRTSDIIIDLLPFITVDMTDADTIYATLDMSGYDTLGVTDSGWWDLLMTDAGSLNHRGYQLVKGRVRRTSVVSNDSGV